MEIIQNILLVIVALELAVLVKLLWSFREPIAEANKVFVRFPGNNKLSYALTERTIHEMQSAGVSLIVEQQ